VKSVAEAAQLVLAQIAELPRRGPELVGLRAARGRVLADDVIAPRALPGFDNSAMDGYAARAAELPATLPIALTVAAGGGEPPELPAGAAARILTGAPIPPGADCVVIQEDATVDDAAQTVALPAAPVGDNVRRAGEDVALGERAISTGARLGPGELGMLAALGITEVLVARAPRVALIATGDELVGVDTAPGPGQLVDSSAHALGAMIADAGGVFDYIGIGRDDPMTLAAMIASAIADHDLVLTTGGVSVGDRDHVRAALASAGVSLELWKVAMRPGKPFSFGHDGRVPVFGLPGNPVSTVVAFELFVRPALLAMQGLAAPAIERPRAPVALARGYRKSAGRAHYLRAHVVRNGEHLVAHPHAKQGSAMLSSLVGCNALVELAAEDTEVAPGALVPALLLEAV
jgi:molybdopterin molybdotransferase